MSIDSTYGSDMSCDGDLDPNGAEVDGLTNLAQDLANRLRTPRGGLVDDPTYGLDLSSYIDDQMSARRVAIAANAIDAELVKDERVIRSDTTATFAVDANGLGKLTAFVVVTPSQGPSFKLTISVDNVTIDLLAVDQLASPGI